MHIQSFSFEEQTILQKFFLNMFRKCPMVTQYDEQIIEIVQSQSKK